MAEVGKAQGKAFRKFTRVKVALRALLKVQSPYAELTCVASTKNISHGGVSLQVDEKTAEVSRCLTEASSRVKLAITLKEDPSPTGGNLKTTWMPCAVRWIVTPSREDTPLTAGLEFDAADRLNIDKIDDFIQSFIQSRKESIYRKRIDAVMQDRDPEGTA